MPEPLRANPPQEQGSIRDLIGLVEGPDEEAALAAIEAMRKAAPSDQASLKSLAYIAENGISKARRKAARRALHALRSRGIEVPSAVPAGPRPPAPEQFTRQEATGETPLPAGAHREAEGKSVAKKCFVSPVLYEGRRWVWLLLSTAPGNLEILIATGDDDKGIDHAYFDATTRKAFAAEVEQFEERKWAPPIESPAVYGLDLLARLEAFAAAKGAGLPLDYVVAKASISDFPRPRERHLVYDHISQLSAKWDARALDDCSQLLAVPEFAAWWVPPERILKHCIDYLNALESSIILTVESKRDRIARIKRNVLRQVFDENGRRVFQMRLEDMAYYLLLKGDRDNAHLAAVAAQGFAPSGVPSLNHPFAQAIVEAWLEFYESAAEEDKEEKRERTRLWVPS